MRLRHKIPALLVPLIVVPLLPLGWITYMELRETTEQRVFGDMEAALDHLAADMIAERKTAIANLDLFARNTVVRKYVLTDDEEQRYSLLLSPLMRVLQSFQEAFPHYDEIRFLLPDGYEDARRVTADIPNLSEEEADNPMFRAMSKAGDRTYSSVFRNPDNGEISLFVGKPLIIRDPAIDAIGVLPKLRGDLVLTISLEEVAKHLREDVIGESGYLFATDAAGAVLFRPARNTMGRTIPEEVLRSALAREKVARDPGGRPGNQDPKNGIHRQHRSPRVAELTGEAVFVVGKSAHRDFHLFAALPEMELLNLSYRFAGVVAVITLVAILVTIVFLVATPEYLVVRPIRRLRDTSKEVGRGNWDARSGVASEDEIGELATAFEDMAGSLKQSDEQVRDLAYHDSLTGLPNRAMVKEYLGRAIAHAKRHEQQLAVLFLDVDDFKQVNDTLGHHAGDSLLQEVAERLSKCLRREDYVARAEGAGTTITPVPASV